MNRTLKLPLMLVLALGCTSAMALRVGQIRVKSALDAPFLADIPLTADYPGEASHVSVGLASAAAFKRAGLDRSQIKAHLKFKVVTNAKGQRVIRVTSSEPVHATYLDFLIKISWSKGSMLREFTALLDPQGMASNQPAPASTASSGGAANPSPRAQQGAAGSSATSTSTSATSGAGNGMYGPVRAGETLGEIAEQARLQGVTLNQMLIALYKANPAAFYRKNINALKRGAVLRIPSRDQATADSVAAAVAAVRRQNIDWQGNAAGSPTMVAHAGGRPGTGTNASGGRQNGDHLSLVPPKSGGDGHAQPGVAGGTGNTSVSGLRQDLARAKESLSNAKRENADLQSQVSSLKSINDKNSKLLSLKSAQVAELQQKLAQARKANASTSAPVSPAAAATSVATAAPAPIASATAGSSAKLAAATSASAVPAAAASATAAAATPSAAGAGKAPQHTTPAQTRVATHRLAPATPWFMQQWAWLVGAALAIVLLLLAWAGLRRKAAGAADGKPSLADQFGDSPFGPGAAAVDADEPMDADQSELLAQLAEHPDDVSLHLELVSLYYARSDVEHFEGAAEAMYPHVGDPEQPEWLDVVAMGRELAPEHPLFADHGDQEDDVPLHDTAAGDEEAPAEFDLGGYVSEHDSEDIDEDIADDAAPPRHADEQAESSGYSFDFDLTPQRGTATSSGEEQPQTPSVDEQPQAPTEDEYDALPPLPEDEADQPILGDEPQEQDDVLLPSPDAPAESTDEDIVETDAGGDEDDEDDDENDRAPVEAAAPASDDPVDTKLDLARAYIDMGDPDGARAMLDEVMAEGSQMQKDTASRLLDEMD